MEDGILSPATMFGVPSDSAMDLDFMDELFLEGCWLETREGTDFLNQTTTTSFIPNNNNNNNNNQNTYPFDPMFPWPLLDTNNAQMNSTTTTTTTAITNHPSFSQDNQSLSTEAQPNTDLSRGLWIAPKRSGSEEPPSATSVIDRLYRALMYIQDVIRDKSVLVQIWVPVNREGKRVLVTSDLPFALDGSCKSLAKYRDISAKYQFSIDDDDDDDLPDGSSDLKPGLPGRVFSRKVPEWTPDVRFFRNDEYPRLRHARLYDVRGTLALPVFEQGSRTCLGVVEVVMTTQKIKYRPELESVCKALEAVDLKSSEVLRAKNVEGRHYETVMPEIREVLGRACETHRLPLAQTWVRCSYQAREGCRHSDENFGDCVSTVDQACQVADPRVQGFHEACSEHHLLRGQGVVGSAFATNQPCFSEDVRSYAKADYPLSHHAALFGMRAAVAIRLRSTQTGPADFVLEFFLPLDCSDPADQRKALASLSLIVQHCCRTLRVVSPEELRAELDDRKPPLSSGADAAAAAEKVEVNVSTVVAEEEREANASTVVEECSASGEGSSARRRTKAEKNITLEVLRQYFAGSLKDAAKSIGVCSTTLKRICRQHGIKRWPSRKIKKVGHSLQKLQLVIDSVQGASGAFQIDSFYSNFPELASPSKLHQKKKPAPPHCEARAAAANNNNDNNNGGTSKSSSSCSQSSSSSQCCTSRSDTRDHQPLKRVRSEAVLNNMDDDDDDDVITKKTVMMPRSQSHKSLLEHRRIRTIGAKTGAVVNDGGPPRPKSDESQRVKVTFGDEKTRFRIHRSWGFADLQREIAGRFGIEDMGVFTIKYLDDDAEWVLLTCDADLEECFEVCSSCQNNTIKLALHASRAFVSQSL